MLVLVFSCWKEVKACLGANRPSVFDFSCPWQFGRQTCQLLICGMGPLSAFRSLRLFLQQEKVCGVLNFGLAGAYNKTLSLGEIVLVTHETWPQDAPVPEHSVFAKKLTVCGQRLKLALPAVATDLGLFFPNWKQVRSVTVHQPSDPVRGRTLSQRSLGEIENMEGFALALACQVAEVPFFEVRTISNFVGETERNRVGFSRACPALHTALAELDL